jgi:lipopolysaccharide transport system permease protein
VVFSLFVRIPSDGYPYPVFAYSAILPWTLLSASLTLGIPSLVRNMNLITRIYFPREILPIASILAGLLDFILGFVIFVGLLIYYRIGLTISILWLPLILSIQLLLMLGVVLFSSALNVFYRDIRYVIPLVLQLWFYLTPIIYPMSAIPKDLRLYLLINPMVGIINSYRRIVLEGAPPLLEDLLVASCISLAIFFFAYKYFKRVELQFADVI